MLPFCSVTVFRCNAVNDCCRRRLATVKMAQYPTVYFVVSDGGCEDFDNGADDLSVLGHC